MCSVFHGRIKTRLLETDGIYQSQNISSKDNILNTNNYDIIEREHIESKMYISGRERMLKENMIYHRDRNRENETDKEKSRERV